MSSVSTVSSAASVEYYARINAEQANIKKQAADLNAAAQKVNTKLKAFTSSGLIATMYQTDKNSSVFQNFGLNAVRDLVKSYNKLKDVESSSDYISDEGKALLDKVKSLLTGSKADTYKAMGLEVNERSGAISFDEQKFSEIIASDPQKVRGALMDNKGLGPILQGVISSMLNNSPTHYFNSSFIINA